MTASEHPQLIAALAAARTAIDSALVALTQEQNAPAQPAAPEQAPAPPDPAAPCTHENRTDLPTFGSKEHWVCDDCGYEFRR